MKCNILTLAAIAGAIALAPGEAAAAGMSKPEYAAAKDRIGADFKAAKAGCAPLGGNAKDVCMEEAKAAEKIGLADLTSRYQPTVKARYDARLARAEGDYSVAREKCDDRSGNSKDVCVKEAEVVRTTALADAKAQMKTADAKAGAGKEIDAARKDAAADKRAATYALAKERCNALSGTAKDDCLTEAKGLFGN